MTDSTRCRLCGLYARLDRALISGAARYHLRCWRLKNAMTNDEREAGR